MHSGCPFSLEVARSTGIACLMTTEIYCLLWNLKIGHIYGINYLYTIK